MAFEVTMDDLRAVSDLGRRPRVYIWHCPTCDKDVTGPFLQLGGSIRCMDCVNAYLDKVKGKG